MAGSHLSIITNLKLLFSFALFFSCHLYEAYGSREVARPHHHVVEMKSFVPASTCSASSTKGLPIAQRYGPCSPLAQDNSIPNSTQILHQDQSRVRSINSLHSNKYSIDANGEGTTLTLSNRDIGAGNFIVIVGFGTPKQDYSLIFDTGSEMTWMQCKPCPDCYQQTDPIYDSSASSTFSNAICSPSCDYTVFYGDKSFSTGHYIRDTLTLTPSTGVFPDFVFGCGQNNSPGFGTAAGVLGLGQDGPLSIISQTSSNINFAKVLCYCLPGSDSSKGYLLFGVEALQTCQTEKSSTPLIRDKNNPYSYFVNLIGITFGDQRLSVSSFVSKTPNTIMDSGTVITRLPPSVYSALRSAFQESMSQYPPAPPLPPLLDTCYNLGGNNTVTATIPRMILHFEDSLDVNLDESAVIWRESDSQVCLAFAGNEDVNGLNIIGNHQQRKLNVLYDILEKKVEISIGGCN